MAVLLPYAKQQFTDANGAPLSLGSVALYVPGTTTFKDSWQDSAQTTLNTNPIVLDIGGYATIYGNGSYRQVVTDKNNNQIWDRVVDTTVSPTIAPTTKTVVDLTYGATVTPDFGPARNFRLTLTGNATLANPTNPSIDQAGVIKVTQDATGGRTLAFGTNWQLPAGAVLSTGANKVDVIRYWQIDTSTILADIIKDMSTPSVTPTTYTNVVVIGGDSNAIGRGSGVRATFTPTSNIQIYNPVADALQTYTPGTNSSVNSGAAGSVTGAWGTEAQFAEDFKAAFPSGKLIIVKGGLDGSRLDNEWTTIGGSYTNLKSWVSRALTLAAGAGATTKVVGGIVHLGTNDANITGSASNFQTNMTAAVPNFRADWQIPSSAPLLWVRVHDNSSDLAYAGTVITAQNNVAASLSTTVKLIQANDAPTDSDGQLHFAVLGHGVLADRCYAGMYSSYTLAEGTPFFLNANFASGIKYWYNYSGTNASWDATGKLSVAGSTGSIVGWMGFLTPGTIYLVDYTGTGIGTTDYQISGCKQLGVALSANVSVPQTGRTNTVGFKADAATNTLYINRTGIAAGVSTFTNFTIRTVGTVGSNLLTNGDFSSGVGWTFTNATLSSGTLVVNQTGGATFATRALASAMVAGGVYRVTVVVTAWTSGTFSAYLSGDGTTQATGMGGAAGTFVYIVHANGAFTNVDFQGTYNGTIDDIKIERLS